MHTIVFVFFFLCVHGSGYGRMYNEEREYISNEDSIAIKELESIPDAIVINPVNVHFLESRISPLLFGGTNIYNCSVLEKHFGERWKPLVRIFPMCEIPPLDETIYMNFCEKYREMFGEETWHTVNRNALLGCENFDPYYGASKEERRAIEEAKAIPNAIDHKFNPTTFSSRLLFDEGEDIRYNCDVLEKHFKRRWEALVRIFPNCKKVIYYFCSWSDAEFKEFDTDTSSLTEFCSEHHAILCKEYRKHYGDEAWHKMDRTLLGCKNFDPTYGQDPNRLNKEERDALCEVRNTPNLQIFNEGDAVSVLRNEVGGFYSCDLVKKYFGERWPYIRRIFPMCEKINNDPVNPPPSPPPSKFDPFTSGIRKALEDAVLAYNIEVNSEGGHLINKPAHCYHVKISGDGWWAAEYNLDC